MHPNPGSRPRRAYSTEFKAAVLAACQQPGASVAAVALAHGLNVNLVRKWLVGRGLKRSGLDAPREVSRVREPAESMTAMAKATAATLLALQFVPVGLTAVAADGHGDSDVRCAPSPPAEAHSDIQVELQRSTAELVVRWPASQTVHCAAWLRELAATALK